jgi:hypothetical protein
VCCVAECRQDNRRTEFLFHGLASEDAEADSFRDGERIYHAFPSHFKNSLCCNFYDRVQFSETESGSNLSSLTVVASLLQISRCEANLPPR